MKTKYLITPTLLNSFNYYLHDNSDEAQTKWLEVLNKSFAGNAYTRRGTEFETKVEEYTRAKPGEYTTVQKQIGDIVSGGMWQVTLRQDLDFNDFDILLYGRCDVWKKNIIYDIKTTNHYEIGKYAQSMQHVVYMFCANIQNFAYLICENDNNFYCEEYNDAGDLEEKIRANVKELITNVQNNETANKIFLDKWTT